MGIFFAIEFVSAGE